MYKARLILPKRVKDEMECMLITSEGRTIMLIATVEPMGDSNVWHLEEAGSRSVAQANGKRRNGNLLADYPFAKLWKGTVDVTPAFCESLHRYIVDNKLSHTEAGEDCSLSSGSISRIIRKQPKIMATATVLAIRMKLFNETENIMISLYSHDGLGGTK